MALPDLWCYQDPYGNLQGPFPKQELIDWYSEAALPPALPVKNATAPQEAPFLPLSGWLVRWGLITPQSGPPGFAPSTPAQTPSCRGACHLINPCPL